MKANTHKTTATIKTPVPRLTKSRNIKSAENNRSAAKTRRQRGYQWEDTIVKRFNNAQNGWSAFRLGSPSIALPDILAVNTKTKHLIVIEAKSGSGNTLFVPTEQVERCLKWVDTFSAYKKRHVILAYKFNSKMRTGLAQYRSRELREYYKVRTSRSKPIECICKYDGSFYTKRKELHSDYKIPVKNAECVMPFKTRQPTDVLNNARIIF